MENKDAMDVQEGGSHYKTMPIQPFEFGHANQYDTEAFSVMKYVARHHIKNGAEDLRKAIHIIDIRVAMTLKHGPNRPSVNVIPVETFIAENSVKPMEAEILRGLHTWALNMAPFPDDKTATILKEHLQQLIDLTYSGELT